MTGATPTGPTDPTTSAGPVDDSTVADLELRMSAEFTPPVPLPMVRGCIEEAFARFREAPIQTYVPLLVERRIRRELGEWTRRSSEVRVDHG